MHVNVPNINLADCVLGENALLWTTLSANFIINMLTYKNKTIFGYIAAEKEWSYMQCV